MAGDPSLAGHPPQVFDVDLEQLGGEGGGEDGRKVGGGGFGRFVHGHKCTAETPILNVNHTLEPIGDSS